LYWRREEWPERRERNGEKRGTERDGKMEGTERDTISQVEDRISGVL
jgi:hypothetical protein